MAGFAAAVIAGGGRGGKLGRRVEGMENRRMEEEGGEETARQLRGNAAKSYP